MQKMLHKYAAAACAAVMMLTGTISAVPQCVFAADSEPVPFHMTFVDSIPATGNMKKIDVIELNKDSGSFPRLFCEEFEDRAYFPDMDTLYFYISPSQYIKKLELDLTINARIEDEIRESQAISVSAHPDLGPLILKVEGDFRNIVSITGDNLEMELDPSSEKTIKLSNPKLCTLALLACADADEPEIWKSLPAVKLPKNTVAISETLCFEQSVQPKNITFSNQNHAYYSFGGDYEQGDSVTYIPNEAQLNFTSIYYSFEQDSPVNGAEAAPYNKIENSSRQTNTFFMDLNNRIYLKETAAKGSNPMNADHFSVEGYIDGYQLEGVPESTGYCMFNLCSMDEIGTPYQLFYLDLSRQSGLQSVPDYAEVEFQVLTSDGEERRCFTVSIDHLKAEAKEDRVSYGTFLIPSNVLKPDNGWLYVAEPHFYSRDENGNLSELRDGWGYAALSGFNVQLGDIDADGAVTASDLKLMKEYLLTGAAIYENSPYSLFGIRLSNADLNGDNVIDVIDYTLLKQKILSAEQ